MTDTARLPRIKKAVPVGLGQKLLVSWKGGEESVVDLAGWIGSGGDALRPLADKATFRNLRVIHYGAAVGWGEDTSGLAIDAYHLWLIAEAQAPFNADDFARWQAEVGFSNKEGADFLRIGLSTFHAYKSGSHKIPRLVAMVCRSSLRDNLLVQAHYRPRITGRPRKDVRAA